MLSSFLLTLALAAAQNGAGADFTGSWTLDVSRPPGFAQTASGRPAGFGPANAARVGGAIRPPVKTRDVPVQYPPEARAAKLYGRVIMEAVIGPEGLIEDLRVLKSAPGLDDAAADAIAQWQYTPTIVDGKAVPLLMVVTSDFSLNAGGPSSEKSPIPSVEIKQDSQSVRMKWKSPALSTTWPLDGKQARVSVGNGGNTVTYVSTSRWDGSKLVTNIGWGTETGTRQRIETMWLENENLIIDREIPLPSGRAAVFRSVYVRAK